VIALLGTVIPLFVIRSRVLFAAAVRVYVLAVVKKPPVVGLMLPPPPET
jgi:hypothetical protein